MGAIGGQRWICLGCLFLLLALTLPGLLSSSESTIRPFGTPAAVGVQGSDLGGVVSTNLSYNSSVDGWPLSYSEWLPANYTPERSYPLAVYLHGQQAVTGIWVPGGVPDDLWQFLGAPNLDGQVARSLVTQLTSAGYLFIALNTRSGAGWYIDSPCGGPQQQDVLDAIHQEEGLRNVSSLYLIGSSMGTEGALYTASLHPGLFRGIAIVSPVTDLFLDVSYRIFLAETQNTTDPWAYASIQAKEHLFCGSLAGTGNATQRQAASMFLNMSPLRFAPQTFASVRLYSTIGGLDDRTPNDAAVWPNWLNVNNTFLTRTCNVAPALGEPSGCTTPLLTLHAQQPSEYQFRVVFDPKAAHGLTALNVSDLLAFWNGSAPGGVYTAPGYPPGAVTPVTGIAYADPASPTYPVEFDASGLAAGTQWTADLGGIDVVTNTTSALISLANGTYPFSYATGPGYLASAGGNLTVSGVGVYVAASFLSTAQYRVAFLARGLPGNLSWAVSAGAQTNTSDSSEIDLTLLNGSYPYTVSAPPLYDNLSAGVVVVDGASLSVNVSLNLTSFALVTFNESGLPNGSAWQVTVDGRSRLSVDTALSFALPNGTFSFSAAPVGVEAAPITGSLTVNGSALQVNLTFGEVLYLATFSESGLADGTTWTVGWNGSSESSTNGTISFPGPNGTYPYTVVAPAGYIATPSTGAVVIAGASTVVAVSFRLRTYDLTFLSAGLPAGTPWSVSVGSETNGSVSGSVGFSVANGSYAYSPGAVSGYVTPPGGRVNVSGAAVQITVAYPKMAWFEVKFTESTLPASTGWGVTLGSGPGSTQSTTGTSVMFSQLNGSYNFQVGRVPGFLAAPSSGSVSVQGAIVRIVVAFTAVKYPVAFGEVGLPTGTSWKVTVGSTSVTSTTPSLNFSLANGSYTYSVGSVSGYTSPTGGTFAVLGPGTTVHLTFVKLAWYAVKFTESGLPKGSTWSVGLGTSTLSTTSSTGTSISFSMKNGSYRFVVTPIAGFRISPSNGSVLVAGATVTIAVAFAVPTYSVVFTESGLASATSWKVTIGSTTVTSTRTTASFALPNGTYGYSVGSVSGYAGPTGGTLVVAGTPLAVGLPFLKVVKFSVKFTETGLPAGTRWNVTMGGKSVTGTGTSLTQSVVNGTYAYSAVASNLPGVYVNGSVRVNGSAIGVKVAFPNGLAISSPSGSAAPGLGPSYPGAVLSARTPLPSRAGR